MNKEEMLECLKPVPTRREGRSQIDNEKISKLFSALAEKFSIPTSCFDTRAISEPNATTRSKYETAGRRLDASKSGVLPEWVFLGRVGVDEALLENIAESMKAQLDGACSLAILFSEQRNWNAYKVFYAPNRKQLANKIGSFFDVSQNDIVEIGPIVPMGDNLVTINTSEKTNEIVDAFYENANIAKINFSKSLLLRYASSLLSKKLLILSGLSGSGKTKLAQAFARWIGPKETQIDPFKEGSEIKSDGQTFLITKSDDRSVEFNSAPDALGAGAISLQRSSIKDWADFIKLNGIDSDTPSKQLRKAFVQASGQSSSLNEFDAHLKAAAFALIDFEKHAAIPRNYEVVPVGADWTGNENILGYPHGLEEGKYVTKQALDLIHRASDSADIPHFLILDEMNLSHVERYFADLLSAIESDEPIRLHHDKERRVNKKSIKPEITLPQNLFIIGTVNVDETTYMFSPKVLDRANVIEFRMDESEVASFLGKPVKPNLELLDGKGASFAKAFVDDAKADAVVPGEVKDAFAAEMLLFFKVLQAYGCEYGYRVAHEAARFMHFYRELGQGKVWDRFAEKGKGAWVDKTADGRTWFHDAFDALAVQKFLPKLNGSEAKLRKPLWALAHLCSGVRDWSACSDEAFRATKVNELADAAKEKGESKSKENDSPTSIAKRMAEDGNLPVYPLSFTKIERMWRAAQTNGFTSFAESI